MMYNTCMRSLFISYLSVVQYEILIISAVAFIGIIFLSVYFGLLNHLEKTHDKEIKDLTNASRIYVVDVKNDKINYFNSAHLKDRRSLSITMFYNQYSSKEREKIINWLGDLLDQNTQTPRFLEAKIFVKSEKQSIPTMLEVQKIDFDKQLIFLESHVLQTEFKARRRGYKLGFDRQDYVYKKILMSNGKGTTLFFNFYNKLTKTSDISQIMYADLRDIILSFASEDILILEHQIGQILITNFNIKTKNEILTFVSEIEAKVNRFLSIKSYSDEIYYSVGIIDNAENFRDVNALVKNVVLVSELCKTSSQKIAFFEESKLLLKDDDSNQFNSGVDDIIENNRLNYYFQPIFDVDRGKIVAYKSTIVPNDSFFKDMTTLRSFALRTEADKELFSTIVRNTISRFVQEKNDYGLKLVFEVSFNELSYAAKVLSRTEGVNDVNLVLVLKEEDLSELPDDYEDEQIMNIIRQFKSKGYSVALEIDDDILTLSPELYSVFDYFNLSVASHIQKKNAGKNLPSFQGLIEKLLHYNKQIVASDIQSWDIVELVYKLGISMICSDAIALPAENILPLQKKTLTKILNLKS